MTETSVLIAECGAVWDAWAIEWCKPSRQLVVVMQGPREPASQFGGRIQHSVGKAARQGVQLRHVVFVGAGRLTGTLTTRTLIVRAIFARLVPLVQTVQVTSVLEDTSRVAERCTKMLAHRLAWEPEPPVVQLHLSSRPDGWTWQWMFHEHTGLSFSTTGIVSCSASGSSASIVGVSGAGYAAARSVPSHRARAPRAIRRAVPCGCRAAASTCNIAFRRPTSRRRRKHAAPRTFRREPLRRGSDRSRWRGRARRLPNRARR